MIMMLVLVSCFSQAAAAEKTDSNSRFQTVGDSIILDSQSGLMWAMQDNGKDTNCYEAIQYCKDFKAGGYTDWRLPDIKELAALYTAGKKTRTDILLSIPSG